MIPCQDYRSADEEKAWSATARDVTNAQNITPWAAQREALVRLTHLEMCNQEDEVAPAGGTPTEPASFEEFGLHEEIKVTKYRPTP